jgi:outer membrane biosynthesis protein TonB
MARAAIMPVPHHARAPVGVGPVSRAPSRAMIPLAIAASLVVHAAGLAALSVAELRAPRAARVTDAPGNERHAPTLLAMAPVVTQPPKPETKPEPQPKPEPKPTPPPEPPKPIEPLPVATSALDEPTKPVEPSPVLPRARPVESAQPAAAPPPPPPVQPVAPPAPPPVTYAGSADSTRARDVIYVLDASGAMLPSLAFAKAELQRSIARLEPSQRFQVIIARRFADAATLDRYPPTPQSASAGAKAKVGVFLESVQAGGRAAPLDALRDALSHKPDLILLLTANFRRSGPASSDPWHSDTLPSAQLQREVATDIAPTLAELDSLNPLRDGILSSGPAQRASVIKAVQFVDEDPTGLLPEIAQRHGDGPGSYRVLTLDEIARLEATPAPR